MNTNDVQRPAIERDPIGNDARKSQRERRFPEGSACVICGETDPLKLISHHVAGRAWADEPQARICKNCHAVTTEDQLDSGLDLAPTSKPAVPDTIQVLLEQLALFLIRCGNSLLEHAEEFAIWLRSLDTFAPGWREATAVSRS